MRILGVAKFFFVAMFGFVTVVMGLSAPASAKPRPTPAVEPEAAWSAMAAARTIRDLQGAALPASIVTPIAKAFMPMLNDPARVLPTVPVTLWDANRNVGMEIQLPVDGVLDPATAEKLGDFFRCRRTDRHKPLDPGVLAIFADLAAKFHGHTVEIVSAYRAMKRESKTSPHRAARAIDLRVRGVSPIAVRDYLWANHQSVGVGWYPQSDFVHIDHRPGEQDIAWTETGGVNHYHPSWSDRARRQATRKPTS
jgi:uncharacterized protein YcbK (DUF882 family)